MTVSAQDLKGTFLKSSPQGSRNFWEEGTEKTVELGGMLWTWQKLWAQELIALDKASQNCR